MDMVCMCIHVDIKIKIYKLIVSLESMNQVNHDKPYQTKNSDLFGILN